MSFLCPIVSQPSGLQHAPVPAKPTQHTPQFFGHEAK